MTFDKVKELLNELRTKYDSRKHHFSTDDYYPFLRNIPETSYKHLLRDVIESCTYFPKPAELKKLSYQYRIETTTEAVTFDGKCVHCKSSLEQYPSPDPYRCTGCNKGHQEYVANEHEQYRNSDILIDQVNIYTGDGSFEALLEEMKRKYL